MAEQPQAVLLHDLHLGRATDQSAILAALFATVGGNRHEPVGVQIAVSAMLGYLSHAHCRGRFVHRDPRDFVDLRRRQDDGLGPKAEIWAEFEKHAAVEGYFGSAPTDGSWDLDFVISPVDGMGALLRGLDAGSLSILAGGPPGSFVDEDEGVSRHYLVVATNPTLEESPEGLSAELLNTGDLFNNDPSVGGESRWRLASNAPKLEELVERLITLICAVLGSGSLVTLATCGRDDFTRQRIIPHLNKHSRARAFNGSSVAACLEVFIPSFGIDAFLGVVRRTHAIQIATAARATFGGFLAIPLTSGEQLGAPPTDLRTSATHPVMRAGDMVPMRGQEEAFLVASGVTESLLLEGIRVRSAPVVSTHSLCLRARTRTSRFIHTHHHLGSKVFRFIRRRGVLARNPNLRMFYQELEKRDVQLNREYLTD